MPTGLGVATTEVGALDDSSRASELGTWVSTCPCSLRLPKLTHSHVQNIPWHSLVGADHLPTLLVGLACKAIMKPILHLYLELHTLAQLKNNRTLAFSCFLTHGRGHGGNRSRLCQACGGGQHIRTVSPGWCSCLMLMMHAKLKEA